MPIPDISRDTFPTNKLKGYSRVTIQQGKAGVDAEVNEEFDRQNFERRQLSSDLLTEGAIGDGFKVVGTSASNSVRIMALGSSQDGTTVGRVKLNGWRLDIPVDFTLSTAGHYLLTGSDYYTLTGFTTPAGNRNDLVYLEAYEEDIPSSVDSYLVDPTIAVECAIRKRITYIIQIATNTTAIPTLSSGHYGMRLAVIARYTGVATIAPADVTDVRPVCALTSTVNSEVITARGSMASLGARLNVSLNNDGTLVSSIVDNSTLQDVANVLSVKDVGVVRTKIGLEAVGTNQLEKTTDASKVQTINIADKAVTYLKIADNTVGTGQLENSTDANKVQRANVANGAIGSGQIEATTDANKVQRVNIGNNVVGTSQIENSTDANKVQRVNIGNGVVGKNQIEQTADADKIQTANIADGAITNVKVNALASIASSKINFSDTIEPGDIKFSFISTSLGKWLLMDGKTVGSLASSGTARNNDDTLSLYTVLWNMPIAWTPMGDAGARGVSASVDFGADRTITIPSMKGKVPLGYNAVDADFNAIGKTAGAKTHGHTVTAHGHTVTINNNTDIANFASGGTGGAGGSHNHTNSVANTSPGTDAISNVPPYVVGNFFIRY